MFNLDAYLARIDYRGRRCANAGVLTDLHEAHAAAIPFENIDVLLRRPIRLDSDSLQAKLVTAKRGGYCFEQNELFAQALEALGFKVVRLGARVRYGATGIRPRTHMVLRVDLDRDHWLADVGFGGEGPLHPIRLQDGIVDRQGAWTYRLVKDHGAWVLRLQHSTVPLDLYSFDELPHHPIDYELANWYTATHPDSHFTRTLTVQRSTHVERLILRNFEFSIDRGAGPPETRRLAGEAEIIALLKERFGLDWPSDARLPELQTALP
jgi:N-hydroxyarylamine O-acetyltransferase